MSIGLEGPSRRATPLRRRRRQPCAQPGPAPDPMDRGRPFRGTLAYIPRYHRLLHALPEGNRMSVRVRRKTGHGRSTESERGKSAVAERPDARRALLHRDHRDRRCVGRRDDAGMTQRSSHRPRRSDQGAAGGGSDRILRVARRGPGRHRGVSGRGPGRHGQAGCPSAKRRDLVDGHRCAVAERRDSVEGRGAHCHGADASARRGRSGRGFDCPSRLIPRLLCPPTPSNLDKGADSTRTQANPPAEIP